MNNDKTNSKFRVDDNLREAIRLEMEAQLPMPADLNARVMRRMAQSRHRPLRRIVPWVAAACVAGLALFVLSFPNEQGEQPVRTQAPTVAVAVRHTHITAQASADRAVIKVVAVAPEPKVGMRKKSGQKEAVGVAGTALVTDSATLVADLQGGPVQTDSEPVVLTEQDLPVTRPENLKYTAEELALLKQRAKEAHRKWLELELEIAEYNLEQTAQQVREMEGK